jgi:hypothetical protein
MRIKNYRKKRQVIATTASVHKELKALGLLHDNCPLRAVTVNRQLLPHFIDPACFIEEASIFSDMFGIKTGHIYIRPFCILDNLFFWQYENILRENIRHEYGHAFAYHYPNLIYDSKEFKSVFGGDYDYNKPTKMEEDAYISDYAETQPAEDFAEMFSEYVLRQGVISKNITNTKLIAKWHFVDDVIKKAVESCK